MTAPTSGPRPSRPPGGSNSPAEPDRLKDDSPLQRKGSFMQTAGAVAWSFFGVRRSADHANDVQKLNPAHVVIAGILGALLFVLCLVLLVRWVINSGVAG